MYTRENFSKVKAMIEARRQSAVSEAEAKNAEVASLSAEIREIDKELRGVGLLIFKTACDGGDIAPIRERNQLLCRRRGEALVRLGFDEDYTEVKYTCSECSDTGFVGAKLCRCFRDLLITENIKSSGMGNLIDKQSFDNFDIERYSYDEKIYTAMKRNLREARAFADGFKLGEGRTLLFQGKTGTGKTHISTAIARSVIERGFEVLYDSAQNIVSAFEQDRFKSGYGPYEPRADKYLECDLLILDDLGTEFINQFTVSCLYNLLNTRQNKGLSTLISTNLSPTELTGKYDDRIFSRLFGADSTVLRFLGKDQRLG